MKVILTFGLMIYLLAFSLSLSAQWENPLVYYMFNETSGAMVVDSSGNNFDSYANWVNCWEIGGKFNGAIHFQGAQKIDLPAKDIALTNEKGTIAFWVLLPESSVSSINCIWWAGKHGGDMFGPHDEMHINSEFTEANIWKGGEIAFVINDSLADESYFIFSDPSKGTIPATPPSANAVTITDSVWHHVACTWESGGTVGLYIDGEEIWNTTFYNPNLWDCNLMTIGVANERNSRRLSGYLDEFRIYNIALKAADVKRIYNYTPDGNVNNIENIKEACIAVLNNYPNPADQHFSFVNSLNIETIEIYNSAGEKLVVKKVFNTNGIVEINISKLSSGFYLIKAFNNDKFVATGKLLKK